MGKNYTLYINQLEFADEDNKSGLVNMLLARHYAQTHNPVKDIVEKAAPKVESQWAEVGAKIQPNAEQFCCSKNTPCRHWQWNYDKEAYVNSISGRIKEPTT